MTGRNHIKTVLVTGNNGFVGRALVSYLRDLPETLFLVGIDGCEATASRVDRQYVGDLGEPSLSLEVLGRHRPDFVIHLAGCTPPATNEQLWAGNVGLAVQLLEASCATGPSPVRVLLIGSAAEYGMTGADRITEAHPARPVTNYGRSKFIQTRVGIDYVARRGLEIIVARPFNLVGPGMSPSLVIGTLCRQLALSGPGGVVQLGNPYSARDFLDVRDAVGAFWQLVQRGLPGEIYNVCSGEAQEISEIAERARGLADSGVELRFDTSVPREGDTPRSCGDPRKLKSQVNWEPQIPLDKSLHDTLGWFRQELCEIRRGG